MTVHIKHKSSSYWGKIFDANIKNQLQLYLIFPFQFIFYFSYYLIYLGYGTLIINEHNGKRHRENDRR